MRKKLQLIFALFVCIPFIACSTEKSGPVTKPAPFRADMLKVPDGGVKKIRGQVLYMPVYSNIPSGSRKKFDMSAFVAVHNTDLHNPITIKRVDFFDTDGNIVGNYISSDQELKPTATKIYTVSKEDQSGTGANFIVEWVADQPVNEPLIESVMTDFSGNIGLAFLSPGKVIRELR